MPRPPRPGGVEMATMVSASCKGYTPGTCVCGAGWHPAAGWNPPVSGAVREDRRGRRARHDRRRPPRSPRPPRSGRRSMGGRGPSYIERRGGSRLRGGSGKAGHARGIYHHVPAGPAPQLSLRTAVSLRSARWITRRSRLFMGLKRKCSPRALHPLGGGDGAQPQLLDAQQAVIVGVEGNARVVFGRHAQHFHGDVFQRQQQFGAIGKQQIHVRAAELHHDVRRLEIVVRRRGILNLVVQLEAAVLQGGVQKAVDAGANRGHGVLSLSQRFISCRSFLEVQWTRRQAFAIEVLLKNHCCPMLTRLLVK